MEIQSGEIYFVREIDRETKTFTNLVKIGLVRKQEGRSSFDRLHEHQTGNPRKLHVEAGDVVHTEAVDRVEALLHQYFAQRRVSGEWFEFHSEQEIQDAIRHTREFAKEVAELVPYLSQAKDLARVPDNGEVVPATDEIQNLFNIWRTARLELDRWADLDALISEKFQAAYEKGADLKQAVKKVTVVRNPKFSETLFKEAEPALYEKYLIAIPNFTQRFLPNAAAKKLVTLPAETEAMYLEVQKGIEAVTEVEETIALNEYVTMLSKHRASAAWLFETSEAQIKVALGENQGFEGVCTWKRTAGEKLTFDEGAFQADHPLMWAEFLSDPKTNTYFLPNRRKAE